MADGDKMHLFSMPMGLGGHIAGWRHPRSNPADILTLGYWRHLAELSEAGKFDALFLADSQGFRPIAGAGAFCQTDAVRFDPVTLTAALSTFTRHLGFICTLSTSYNEPYSVARRLATLDHVSAGRAGWNVVTSTSENEAHNFGRESHYGHAERYARAGEFVDVVKGLWDGWDDDAYLFDRNGGRFFDPAKVHGLFHQGAQFKVAGPLTLGRPPQGHPVVVQAGASEDGLQLAARTAEAVFTSHPTLDSATAFYADLKRRVTDAGRPADSLRILCAVQPIVAASREAAEQEARALDGMIPVELAIAQLQMSLGNVDLSGCDPDGPLPELPDSNASLGTRRRILDLSRDEGLSLGQIALRTASARTSMMLTGGPEDVADRLQTWFEAGAADGFVVAPPALPVMLERFVETVVPILQARGVFREHYDGPTLRDHLGLERPVSRYETDPGLHREPEIWQPK